jgi:hypothetical protein
VSLLCYSPPEPAVVEISVSVNEHLHWTAAVLGKIVPASSVVLQKCPLHIQSVEILHTVCNALQTAQKCVGNTKPDFVSLVEDKGGVILNKEGGVSAYLDKSSRTVRHQNCDILCESGSIQCKVCHHYTATLRSLKHREKNQDKGCRTSHDSHTNYRYLHPSELTERLDNVQKAKRSARRAVERLQHKLDKIIESEGIELHEDDQQDVEALITCANDEVVKKYSKDDFQRIFWEHQQCYNKLKDKRRMRWHPLMVRFALNLRYLSSTAYKAVRSFLALPSQRTLQDYTHVMKFEAGTSSAVVNRMKEDMGFQDSTSSKRKVALLLDEMKIKAGLVFNKSSGKLVGFVDLPNIGNELENLETMMRGDNSKPSPQPQLAEHMLVVMARSIFQPSFTFPVAQYPTSTLSADKLYPLVWGVVEALELNELEVTSFTCDGLSANRKFFRISKDVAKSLKIPFKTTNPYNQDRSVYFFCDVPHLLKTTRNCFSNSYAHSHSRKLTVSSLLCSCMLIQF